MISKFYLIKITQKAKLHKRKQCTTFKGDIKALPRQNDNI